MTANSFFTYTMHEEDIPVSQTLYDEPLEAAVVAMKPPSTFCAAATLQLGSNQASSGYASSKKSRNQRKSMRRAAWNSY
jgi:hypothetical protein